MSGAIKDFIKGLNILYADKMDEKYNIQAEHDVIYVGGDGI